MEIWDFFVDIDNKGIESILEKESQVKKLIQFGDINLRTITGYMILKNAESCLRIAENALNFYKEAMKKTKYIEVVELCDERIRLANNAKAVIEPYLKGPGAVQ